VKSKIDIFFVLGRKNRLLNISLPTVLVWVLAGVAAAIIVSFVIVLTDYTNRQVDQKSISKLHRENDALRTELKKYDNLCKEFDLSMTDLQKYDAKLRIYSGLELINSDVRQTGVGGFQHDTAVAVLGGEVRDQVITVSSTLMQLLAEAKFQRESFEQIAGHLKDRQYLRDHTPSILPINGWYMSGYGMRIDPFTGYLRMHEGLDLAAPPGTPIVAPANGIVKSIDHREGYGLTVEIDHGYGIKTYYAHCLSSLCQVGQSVKRGDLIATVGETGRATGPHCHYEVHVAGATTNPTRYIIQQSTITD